MEAAQQEEEEEEEEEQEFVERYEVQMLEGGRLGDDEALSALPPQWKRLDYAATGAPPFIPGGLEKQVNTNVASQNFNYFY